MFGSLRKIEFSTSSRSGNVVKLGLQIFDILSYVEQRLMWFVSGSEDTKRQISQILEQTEDFKICKTHIGKQFQLWAAARLRFRELSKVELSAAWARLVGQAARFMIESTEWQIHEIQKKLEFNASQVMKMQQWISMYMEISKLNWMEIELGW